LVRAVVLLLACALAAAIVPPASDVSLYTQFTAFESQYQRAYSSHSVRMAKFETFKSNLKAAQELNLLHAGKAQFGVTKFADMTAEEFATKILMTNYTDPIMPPTNVAAELKGVIYPPTLDWRTMDMVSPVQNQGECGACWAFATTGEIESQWRIGGESPDIQFSAQQMVDCDSYDDGCSGGSASNAFMYVSQAGLLQQMDYPYDGQQQTCSYNSAEAQPAIASPSTETPGTDVTDILAYMFEHGPTTAVIDATKLQLYTSGVVSLPDDYCPNLNHMILLVGYDSNQGFFVGKNSWGTDWGENGFFQMTVESCMINEAVVGGAAAAA